MLGPRQGALSRRDRRWESTRSSRARCAARAALGRACLPAVSFGGIDLQPRLPFVNVCPAGGGEGRASRVPPHWAGPVLAEPPPRSTARPRLFARAALARLFVCFHYPPRGGAAPGGRAPSHPRSLKAGRLPPVGAAGAAPGHAAGLRARCPPRPAGAVVPSAALARRPSVPGGSAPSTDRRRAGAAPPARAPRPHRAAAAAPGSAASGEPRAAPRAGSVLSFPSSAERVRPCPASAPRTATAGGARPQLHLRPGGPAPGRAPRRAGAGPAPSRLMDEAARSPGAGVC